jgi:hypothetical protein
MDTKPLVYNFSDLTFICSVSFMNDHYQERASNPSIARTMLVTNSNDNYIMESKFMIHDVKFVNDYAITGEYNISFTIGTQTRICSFSLVASVVVTKNILRHLIDGDGDPVLNTNAYFFNLIDDNDLFPMRIIFKRKRGYLIFSRIEINLPKNLCDDWYKLFAKYHSLRLHGPQLI